MTPEHVQNALKADLAQWLKASGIELKSVGRWHRTEAHSSLRIQGNRWYHNSKGIGGNAIQYLVKYFGYTVNDAIVELSKLEKNVVKEKNIKCMCKCDSSHNEFVFGNISLHKDQRRVLAYLVKTRGIPAFEVLSQINSGNLFQESKTGNAIFPMKNEKGEIIGAEVCGTLNFENTRYKGIKQNSDMAYGFAVGEKQNPQYILFFESAIDLLSFITISKAKGKTLKSCLFVSMAGLRFAVFENMIRTFGNSETIPVLCTDNDVAGKTFTDHCRSIHKTAVAKSPDSNSKDWNEQLLKSL